MKVLLIAHSISPLRGSEPGLGWNWAWYLSRRHEVWVISHPEFRSEVDEFLAEHPDPRLRIFWLEGSTWDPLQHRRGLALHYLKWLHQAERLGDRLNSSISFDLVHHVSFASVSLPPKLWRMGIPLIWGPLGGGQTCPQPLMRLMEGSQITEYFRTIRVKLLPYWPWFRETVKNAAAVLATNIETQQMLLAAGATNVPLFWDNGIPDEMIPSAPVSRQIGKTIRVLWASKIEKRKALPLALQAMSRIGREVPVELVVAGDGPDRENCVKKAAELGVTDRVRFRGFVRPTDMQQELRDADIFLFTSIRDSCASVVLEAMCNALPVVTLDLHGVGAYMPAAAGIKIPITNIQEVVQRLARSIEELAINHQMRMERGLQAWQYAKKRCWSTRADRMTQIYQDCLPTP